MSEKTHSKDVSHATQEYAQAWNESMEPQPVYLGHTAQYWGDIAIAWLPLVAILAFFVLFGRKRRKRYVDTYELSVERQALALKSMERTNQLLEEISQ